MRKWKSSDLSCRIYTKLLCRAPKRIANFLLFKFRNSDGNFGFSIRYAIYNRLLAHVGENVKIFPLVYIYYPERLSIFDNTTIHEFSVLECKGGVSIGSGTSIAHKFSLLSSTHLFNTSSEKSFRDFGLESKKTTIGENVWIGAGVIITYGIDIGNNCIIGGQSFINKSVDSNHLVAGVPGRIIK